MMPKIVRRAAGKNVSNEPATKPNKMFFKDQG
jgi:hypothetical protein